MRINILIDVRGQQEVLIGVPRGRVLMYGRNHCGSSELPVLPAFAIKKWQIKKTWQISPALDNSISTSCCAARKSQSIRRPASSISPPPQTHTYPSLLVCFSAHLPTSPNPPAVRKTQSFWLLLCNLPDGDVRGGYFARLDNTDRLPSVFRENQEERWGETRETRMCSRKVSWGGWTCSISIKCRWTRYGHHHLSPPH